MLGAIPHVRLFDAPTPLEHMARIGAHAGHPQLWVKRDDCMPLAFGGNKVRNLEFWLGEALEQGCDILVVAGAPASNQCRLTAAAASKTGLDCLVLYAGVEPLPDHPNLRLTALLGAQIRVLGPVGEDERGRLARDAAAELRRAGRRPYLVGDPGVGALGYVKAAQELRDQTLARQLDLRHVVLPGSMGVTEAGMILGAALLELPWTFHLVSVEYGAVELEERIRPILSGLCHRLGRPPVADALRRVHIHTNQLGDGYGCPTADSLHAATLFAKLEALTLEQTYVAKSFAGLLTCVAERIIAPDEPACILHTGGTPSVFGEILPAA